MSSYQMSILGHSTVPDPSGFVYPQPYAVTAVNDLWNSLVMVFDDSGTRIGLRGRFTVPQNYVGSAAIVPVWSSIANTGNAVWDFEYRAVGGDDAESLDQATPQESVSVTDAAPSVANERNTPQLSLTSVNLSPGDTVEFELFRDGADANDTMAAAALLFDLLFQYDDA